MQIRKLIQRKIRHAEGGINVDSDVTAVVAANVGERGAVTHASSTQRSATESVPSKREHDEAD